MIIWFLSSRALCLNLPFRASAEQDVCTLAMVCNGFDGVADRQLTRGADDVTERQD
jgi:hypothetical protein